MSRPGLRNGSSLLSLRRKATLEEATAHSEPPPSPHQAYFDKYPRRTPESIEFPTMERRGGLRDWRVVQAHLEPRLKRKEIRDPDDMVIVSLAHNSPPPEPVVIASSSVEAMDALIDSMGSNLSLDSMSFLPRSSRYPLYQPPLPTPPHGVKLGIADPWLKGKKRADDTDTETDEPFFPRRTPTTSFSACSAIGPSRNSGSSFWSAPSTSTAASSRTSTPAPSLAVPEPSHLPDPPARLKSDEEIEADERADVTSPLVPPARVRQRSGLSARSARSARNVSGTSIRSTSSARTISTSSTGSSVYKARYSTLARSPAMWDLAADDPDLDPTVHRSIVPSISDIIRTHAPAVVAATQAVSKRSVSGGSKSSTPKTTPGHSRAVSQELTLDDIARSSVDSIAEEAQRSLQAVPSRPIATPRRPGTAGSYSSPNTPRLEHARSFTKSRASSVQGDSLPSPYLRAPLSDGASICSGTSGNTIVLPRNVSAGDNVLEMAQYLRSPRLTRLLTLRRPAHAGLTVSLADVGSLTGRPVLVYLGLGCVRYLVALYDEMAEALNLRLICIDRWGLGRTSDVANEKRGLLEWAGVVEEVADILGLGRYSVLAHSAGAPYALASSLKSGERVFGSVHLLAPWVSMAVDGGYKWLKYVPNGLIKTAQAAEWRFQGWMLGKPPTIQYEGIGFDASAPISRDTLGVGSVRRLSFDSLSEYDEVNDFEGRFASRTALAHTHALPVEEDPRERGAKTPKGKGKDKSRQDELDSSPRSRKGSKIFGGLFGASGPKKSASTPPSAYPPISRGPNDDLALPDSPTSPLEPPPPPKLKGLRSVSSLKSQSAKSEPGKKSSSREREREQMGLGLGMEEDDGCSARTLAWASEFGQVDVFRVSSSSSSSRQRRSLSLSTRPHQSTPSSPAPPPPSPKSPNPNPKTVTLASALLQASHAESLKGGTADLLSILERDSKPWGFSYADVRQPVRVWYGDRDDKIGIGSVRWMERVMKSCEVKIVKGAGHGLMTNADVVVEVLESIAREWQDGE